MDIPHQAKGLGYRQYWIFFKDIYLIFEGQEEIFEGIFPSLKIQQSSVIIINWQILLLLYDLCSSTVIHYIDIILFICHIAYQSKVTQVIENF